MNSAPVHPIQTGTNPNPYEKRPTAPLPDAHVIEYFSRQQLAYKRYSYSMKLLLRWRAVHDPATKPGPRTLSRQAQTGTSSARGHAHKC